MACKSEAINSTSHKTVIIIDRSRKFCQKIHEPTALFQTTDDEKTPTNRISRWSVVIQSIFEFQRILSDIFPHGTKQIRLCVSDTAAKFITATWSEKSITYNEILKAFLENQPDLDASSASSLIINGLNIAMDALTTPTVQQSKVLKMNMETHSLPEKFSGTRMPEIKSKSHKKGTSQFYKRLEKVRPTVQRNIFGTHFLPEIENLGTIMVFTCIESVDKLKEIINCVEELVYERNELYKVSATQADITILPISQLRFLIVHIDGGEEPKVTQDFITSCESYCLTRRGLVKPTIYFANGTASTNKAVYQILCSDYDIASTTVTNIPMKEESDPKKSQNYDVEIFHHKRTHTFFNRHNLLEPDSPISSKVDSKYITAKLKWSNVNNKLNASEPPLFNISSLVTLASVRARPSTCFCSFLMNGKSVLLDVNSPKPLSMVTTNFANTTISHFCTADFNNGAMTMKSVSFDLAKSFKRLSKQKFADAEINSYKNILLLKKIEAIPIKGVLIDQNPRPLFEMQRVDSLSSAQIEGPRSESPVSKKTKLQSHNWVMNDTIDLHEYFAKKNEQCWDRWNDFVGRTSLDASASLYPNLQVTERTEQPQGGVRPNRPRRGR